MAIIYRQGSELPNPEVTWRDSDGAVRDFASGWTFIVRVGLEGQEALIEKTSGITPAASSPNVLIQWDPGELDVLTAGVVYKVDIEATFTSTGQSIVLPIEIQTQAGVLPQVP